MSNKIQEFEHKLAEEGEKVLQEVGEALHLKKKKPLYKKIWPWVLAGFVILLFLLAAGYLRYWMPFKTVLRESQRAQTYFLTAQEQLLNADFKAGSESLDKAKQSLDRMEKGINSFGVMAKIGPLENQYNALKGMVVVGQNLSSGLKMATDLTSNILSPLEKSPNKRISDITTAEKREILKMFYESSPEIQGAKAQIELARLELENIDRQGLHPLLETYVKETSIKLDEIYEVLDRFAVMSKVLPNLLGYPTSRSYLFLLENNGELRATGGFIGTVGVLKVKDAEIQSFETRNVYELDIRAENVLKIKAPDPITKYMGVKYWYLRDANWSPDFPTSAINVENFFNSESRLPNTPFAPQKFDGVIAITPQVIQDFLSLAGAVEVKGFVFSEGNFVERLQYLVEVGYEEVGSSFSERKDIIGTLSQDMFDRFEKMQIKDWIKLVDMLETNLKEKHILVYLDDPILQTEAARQGWTGAVKDTPLDYLMVIDSNLAALKTDQYMKKSVVYKVRENEDKDLIARVDISYENEGSFSWKSTRYRTYTRVYVPKGSEWIKTEGSMENDRTSIPGKTDVYDELGKTVFGTFISIEPGEKGTLSFEYKLPEDVKEIIETGHYNLLVQKQPGTEAHQIYLDLDFNRKLSGAKPAEVKENWGDDKYIMVSDLREDREFIVSF